MDSDSTAGHRRQVEDGAALKRNVPHAAAKTWPTGRDWSLTGQEPLLTHPLCPRWDIWVRGRGALDTISKPAHLLGEPLVTPPPLQGNARIDVTWEKM